MNDQKTETPEALKRPRMWGFQYDLPIRAHHVQHAIEQICGDAKCWPVDIEMRLVKRTKTIVLYTDDEMKRRP